MTSSNLPAQHRAGSVQKSRPGWLSWLREVGLVLILALVISTLLRLFVVQVFSIPSVSMVPTLEVGDRILVSRLPGATSGIQRGDVVVFEDSQGWMEEVPAEGRSFLRPVGEFLGIIPADGRQIIVKRVIGVGGDEVSCCSANGKLTVNGTEVDEDYLAEPGRVASGPFTVQVPEGHYWVMGDNRDNSADSLRHYMMGEQPYIAADDVVGPVQWVIWPFSNWSSVAQRDSFGDVSER